MDTTSEQEKIIKEIYLEVEQELEQSAQLELKKIEEEIQTQKKQRQKKRVRLVLKSCLIAVELFVLAVVVYVAFIAVTSSDKKQMVSRLASGKLGSAVIHLFGGSIYNDNIKDDNFNEDEIITNENDDKESIFKDRYTTYALFGLEAYDASFDSGANSDAIMIISIDRDTKEVRIASIYRDSYLQIQNPFGPDTSEFSKINAAYSWGGAICAVNSLNVNLDLHITDYATVNWGGVSAIIDALGGVDVNLTEDEVYQLNYHMGATAHGIGTSVDRVTESGWNHLNGVQATTYCRIRGVSFFDPDTGEEIMDDFGRAARQQYIVKLLVQKAKAADINTLFQLLNVLSKNSTATGNKIFGSSLELQEIIDMIPVLIDFNIGGTYGFPETKETPTIDGASLVVAADLYYNVELLHKFLYPAINDYRISGRVSELSSEISLYTGVGLIERMEESE